MDNNKKLQFSFSLDNSLEEIYISSKNKIEGDKLQHKTVNKNETTNKNQLNYSSITQKFICFFH